MRVKICGLCRPGDARLAAESGAHYCGVILAPGGPRSQTVARAAEIFASTGSVERVGVFVNASVDDVVAAAGALRLSVLQLHGSEPPSLVETLRGAGSWRVWKALRPRSGEEFAAGLERYAPVADGILVDGWSGSVAGGAGVAFEWSAVARYRDRIPSGTEWIIAGGLTAGNVAGAIAVLGPDTVDVSSGVESDRGVKAEAKVRAFIEVARTAASQEARGSA